MQTVPAEVISMAVDAGILLTIVACVFAATIGALMLISPPLVTRLGGKLNRHISARRAMRSVELPRYQEPFFYRHHRVIGPLLILVTLFFFYRYFFDYDPHAAITYLSGAGNRVIMEPLIQALTIFLLIGNALILLLGVVISIRPSLLKPVEAWANYWVSMRRGTRVLHDSRDTLDRLFATYPRPMGAAILIGSLYALISFALVWKG